MKHLHHVGSLLEGRAEPEDVGFDCCISALNLSILNRSLQQVGLPRAVLPNRLRCQHNGFPAPCTFCADIGVISLAMPSFHIFT